MNIRRNIIRLYYKVRLFMAEMNKDQIPSFAAQAAFFLLLSVFPLMMALLTLVKYLPFTQNQVVGLINEIIPNAI